MVKRIVTLFLCLTLIVSVFPEIFPDKGEVEALDSNIIEYADVVIPAYKVSETYEESYTKSTIKFDVPEIIITNITYNKITKDLKFLMPDVKFNMYLFRDDGINFPDYAWSLQAFLQLDVYCDTFSDNGYFPNGGAAFHANYHNFPAEQIYSPFPNYTVNPIATSILENGTYMKNAYNMDWYSRPYPAYILLSEPTIFKYRFLVRNSMSYAPHFGGASIKDFWWDDSRDIPLIKNTAPTLSLTTPSGQTLQNDTGKNLLNVEGYVQDADNNDVTVSAEIPNVLYKKITVPKAGNTKAFSIPIDVLADAIPPGDYTVNVKVVDPSNASASASMSFKVRQRLKRSAFVLINSPIQNSTSYSDYEGDTKYAERFKYQHNPDYFDNSMGLLADSQAWRTLPYESFALTGYYVVTYQPKDTPTADNRFDEYRMWGSDNFTKLSFQVHRKPIALFAAKLVGGAVQITDSSYDSDHISRVDKGLTQRQWQYKKGEEELWTDGTPSGALSPTDNYNIRLRVRDIDGDNALGVWSDWCVRTVGTAAGNLPPVALFTVEPSTVSYRKATTITDKSFDPDNDRLDTYQWTVVKNGSQTVWTYSGAAKTPPNIASYGVGTYVLTLKVRDNRALWSAPYSQSVTVMNHPPIADFNMPTEVYRDTVISLENLTPDPDQDGDTLTYTWKAANREGTSYAAGTNRNQSVVMQNIIKANNLSPKQSISDRWEMKLTASDGSLSSTVSRMFTVLNHTPSASINGRSVAYQYDTLSFVSADVDEDTADQATLRYYWNITDSSGQMTSYTTPNIQVSFPEAGSYRLEHWVIDQIGAKSNVATLDVNVIPNEAPSMILTLPAGTAATPSVIDAQLQGDPLVKWTYSDPENDPQEQYQLEFYDKGKSLVKTIQSSDPTGTLRQYQIPNPTFERFVYFYLYGRTYSKGSWSEISNEKVFILDNPPQPGFTLITDKGKDASRVSIFRSDIVSITSTASDVDVAKGDSVTAKYYIKPAGGTESLASTQANFTKQFSSTGSFTIRQVVTDSLGLFRELTQMITVINRAPVVNLTHPSGSLSDPTAVNTLTPTIQWTYQDEDGDIQQKFRVRIIDTVTGNVVANSTEKTSSTAQWVVPAGTLAINKVYAVEVEASDGDLWSNTSRKYLLTNRPPVPGFEWGSQTVWEGDHVYLKNTSTDPDGDVITSTWTIQHLTRSELNFTSNLFEPVIKFAQPEKYRVTLNVCDSWGLCNVNPLVKEVTVLPISITGQVFHTDLWQSHLDKFNAAAQAAGRTKRPANYFFPGERFMLRSNTVGPHIVKVDAKLLNALKVETTYKANLPGSPNLWNGSLWAEEMVKWKDQNLYFRFTLTTDTGYTKVGADVPVRIQDDEYWRQHNIR